MKQFVSLVALSHLQAFRFWLRSFAPGWNISLPEEHEVVGEGKEYPPFHLYRHGISVGIVDTPHQALKQIGERMLLQDYERFVIQDPDRPDDQTV